MSGPLDGIKIIELSHEACAWAAKLLADLGAEAIVVEPPGGSAQREFGPFVDDEADSERCLWWWHYNTSKHSVVLDLDRESDRAQLLDALRAADVLVEAEVPGRLASLALDYADLSQVNPRLVHVSITPYGRQSAKSLLPATDLTVLAAAGPAWSCGYDDHTLPPVRGGGNQGYQTACHIGVMSVLAALLEREVSGLGQFIDVSMHACSNTTTEMASYGYLATGDEVMRLTGRHAAPRPSQPTQALCADGNWLNTGVPPRNPKEFGQMIDWLDSLGLRDEFPLSALLEMGAQRERITMADVVHDPLVGEIFGAGREAMWWIASKVSAYDFFIGAQSRGLACGVIYAPEDVLEDPHFVERGFPVSVEHPELGRSYTYPGAPYVFRGTPWEIRHRAPLLGEHQPILAEWASQAT